ncbi:hypothetical protein SRHO_G00340830 [Serrasalmus rhombeus]
MPPKSKQDRGAVERWELEQAMGQSSSEDQATAAAQDSMQSEAAARPATSTEGIIAELASMVKVLVQSQVARDERMSQVEARHEQRWRSVQHQFQQLQGHVESSIPASSERGSEVASSRPVSPQRMLPMGDFKEPKLHPLTEGDDVEQFLATFERIATACRWSRENWAIRLVPLLTGKARSAYVAMDISYTNDYKKVKEVILKKYEISAETYRQRFRATDIWPDETPRELYVRLKELFAKWTKPEEHTVQQMSEILILEQFMRMVSPDMAVWIKEHDPGTAEEAARLAEVYISARKSTTGNSFSQWTPRPQSKSFGDGGVQGHAQSKSNAFSRQLGKSSKQEVKCYYCGEKGHTKPYCQARKAKNSAICYVPRPSLPHSAQVTPKNVVQVLVNGQAAQALVDTGSTQTLVLESLVPEAEGSEQVKICNVVTRARVIKDSWKELPFADSVIESEPVKVPKSRRERRREKVRGTELSGEDVLPAPPVTIDMQIPEDIVQLQKVDPTLQGWFQKVSEVDGVRQGKPQDLADEKVPAYLGERGRPCSATKSSGN